MFPCGALGRILHPRRQVVRARKPILSWGFMLGGIGETRFDCCGADVDSVARPLITCVRRDDHTAEPLGSEGSASPWGVVEPDLNACEMTAASQPVCTGTWIDGSLTGCCSGLSGFSCGLFGVPPWPLVAATIGRIPSRPSSRMPLLRPVLSLIHI